MLPNWQMTGLDVDEIPIDNPYGFIYQITYEDGTYYYGKKDFYSTVRLPALKSGKQRPNSKRIGKNKNGKRVYFDEFQKESSWKKYTGSNDIDLPISKREILTFASSKRNLTYLEVKYLFKLDALEDNNCHNQNINGMWFKGNLE